MSANTLNCRRCRAPLVITHASGRIEFKAAIESFTPNGPRGACYWLVCTCGQRRDWINPREAKAA